MKNVKIRVGFLWLERSSSIV